MGLDIEDRPGAMYTPPGSLAGMTKSQLRSAKRELEEYQSRVLGESDLADGSIPENVLRERRLAQEKIWTIQECLGS